MNQITVDVNKKGAKTGDLFGIFFEDLNHAADGGLYAELIQNRSFEFDSIDHPSYHALLAWEKVERGTAKAEISVENTSPLNEKNLNYLVIQTLEGGQGAGVANLGFNTGIPYQEGENYLFSFYARTDNGEVPVCVQLESKDGKVYAKTEFIVNASQWQKYEALMTPNTTDFSGRLTLTTTVPSTIYMDMVSLFPENTFLNRPNGLRKDIAQLLADMKPKFMRFPGGCLVHDGSLNEDDRDSLYRWKNTIGALEKRPPRRNNWQYNQTLGLGYYEYFQFCEDIGTKAIPVLPAGYDPHHHRVVPMEDLQPWIDDALDLIEFAKGDVSTVWGAKRAELGHPEPFGLEYIGIGNEEVGAPFFERYTVFHQAIKAKYPEIKIINTSGPFSAGGEYERGWASARENHSDLVDEHYYQAPEWFLANYHRYDNFKADEPKVFLGEYASWGNTYYNALTEAAYMTGLEKNAHAVGLACYAPMLCNTDYVNWKPDMIWFNNHEVFGTPNYYVQKLFMHHQGDELLEINSNLKAEAPQEQEPITGFLSLLCDEAEVQYDNITIINRDTEEKRTYEAVFAAENQAVYDIAQTEWQNYTISMTAKKVGGKRGFKIAFGKKDSENNLVWEIGGWQNQDSTLCANVSGRNSCLTQSLFAVEKNKEYQLVLEISGRTIKAYIDGVLINEAEDKLPLIEPLYYSAAVEESSGDIIIKAVNMQEEKITVQLLLQGLNIPSGSKVKVFEMAGYQPEDENSFENPQKVAPIEKVIKIDSHEFDYEFPEKSLTIFRIASVVR